MKPRLAFPLVHEAALCSIGLREQRVLSQRGFELANGLSFVASDVAMHRLLAEHTVAESQRLQVALGRIRRASGDYVGKLLAIDPQVPWLYGFNMTALDYLIRAEPRASARAAPWFSVLPSRFETAQAEACGS